MLALVGLHSLAVNLGRDVLCERRAMQGALWPDAMSLTAALRACPTCHFTTALSSFVLQGHDYNADSVTSHANWLGSICCQWRSQACMPRHFVRVMFSCVDLAKWLLTSTAVCIVHVQ